MDPIVWPKTLLVPGTVKLALQNQSRGGGAGVAGVEQVVVSPSARWSIAFSGFAIRTREQVKAWRAIEAQADGRANALVVPAYDWARGPVRDQLAGGVSFGSGPFLPSTSSIATSAGAAINATALSVSWTGPGPEPGQHFSIGAQLYRVATLASTGANAATLTVRPWLRGPVGAGVALNFDDPVCLVRLAKDDGLALDLEKWRFASPSVEFLESL